MKQAAALRVARSSKGLDAYGAGLREADREILEELVRGAKLATVDQYARRLLDDAIRREKDRRRGAVVRTPIRDEWFAHRWSEAIARAMNEGLVHGPVAWVWIDHPNGRARALKEYRPTTRGVSDILDARERARQAMADERGSITAASISAWLTGKPAPTGEE